ncbi:MAG: murein transglycosylase [Actinophytocola sp.]|nr:murein transglycosylase [Actinophytocola sp.]
MPNAGDADASQSTIEQADKPLGHGKAILLRLGIVVGVLAVAGGSVWGLTRAATLKESPTTMEIPALSVQAANVEPGSVAPINATIKGVPKPEKQQPAPKRSQGGDPLAEWASRAGPVIGIHPRALAAYGRAEVSTRQTHPSCNLSWATLAGIGRVESNHGQYGGAVLQDDGLPSRPIIGVPLDGSKGFKAIKDTDGGQLDGDAKVDRAVGPMQFIPSTWARHAADGNRDGSADPQQIDDAVLAAANYLCAGGRNMAGADGWWAGLWSYNQSVEYGQKVFGLADHYAKAMKNVR